jgi:hypothetical protein
MQVKLSGEKQSAANIAKKLQSEIDSLKEQLKTPAPSPAQQPPIPKTDDKPLPCFHPLPFKRERLEPTTSSLPYHSRITITPATKIQNPQFWVYMRGDAGGIQPNLSGLSCNTSVDIVNGILEFNCRQEITQVNPFQFELQTQFPSDVLCIEDRTAKQ